MINWSDNSSDGSIEKTPKIHQVVAEENEKKIKPTALWNDSDSDNEVMEVGCKKNPDDKGEGENVKHSEDLVGIQNTVTHDTIKFVVFTVVLR